MNSTFWVIAFQLLKIFNGLIAVLLVPIYLSSHEQGIWFLMLSFGSIILLFSASQNGIVLIFGSHEFKNLRVKDSLVSGDSSEKNKLFSFVKYSNLFFIYILTIISFFVFAIFYFYTKSDLNTETIFIFFVYCIGLYLYAINYSMLSYIESFNEVRYAYILKTALMTFIVATTAILLMNNYHLYSLSISFFTTMLISTILLLYKFKNLLVEIVETKAVFSRLKKKVFLNYFVKNSFSMVSGFLLFQIYTPIVYYYKGFELTGKVGLSIAIFTALFAVSTAFIQAKLPHVINLISKKQYSNAYEIYFLSAKKAILIFVVFLSLGLFLLFKVELFSIYQERTVEFASFIILSISWLFQILVYILVTYIRCFKRELFIIPTIVSIAYILVVTVFILKNYQDDHSENQTGYG